MILQVYSREPKPPEPPPCPFELFGKLEYDWKRGVLYFHGNDGTTKLRICRLPVLEKAPGPNFHLDITHMHGAMIAND